MTLLAGEVKFLKPCPLCGHRTRHEDEVCYCEVPDCNCDRTDVPGFYDREPQYSAIPTALVERLREGLPSDVCAMDDHEAARYEAANKLERLIWLVNGWPGQRGDRIREIFR